MKNAAWPAWAITATFIDSRGPSFVGVFWFNGSKSLEPWHDAMRTAVWRTRREARAALNDGKARGLPTDAKVVRVRIDVSQR